MTVIFLDIDGCLRTHKSDTEWSLIINEPIPFKVFDRKFSNKAVSNINYIYSITNCKLVISSTWRCNYTLEELRNIFRNNGIYAPIIDKTIIGLNRGEEIEQWLDTHEVKNMLLLMIKLMILRTY